ncbi:MAG TPA: hypothetical protein VEJ63_11220 [Planctomycetota bacterium]|nr:hypothetical protein [Planctomycetota bacterium]
MQPLTLTIAAVACLAGSALALEVAFEVEEAGDVERKKAHVTGGIPFNKDVLKDADVTKLRLYDDAGKQIAFIPTVTSRWSWPDGNVQWLLLDFQADFAAKQKRRFVLKTSEDAPAKAAAELKVTDAADAIVIDTGAATFTISKKKFALAAGSLGGKGLLRDGEMSIDLLKKVPEKTDEENWLRDAPPDAPVSKLLAGQGSYKAEIEEQNPLRIVVKLTGDFGDRRLQPEGASAKFPYIIRLTMHAGSAELHVKHTLIYDGDPKTECIRRIGVHLPIADLSEAAVGGQGDDPLASEPEAPKRIGEAPEVVTSEVTPDARLSLLCMGPPKRYHDAPIYDMARIKFSIDQLGDGPAILKGGGDSPQGWIAAGNKDGTVGVAFKDFWRKHPKELDVDGGRKTINVWLWPNRGDRVLDLRRYSDNKVYKELNPGEGWRFEAPDQSFGMAYGHAFGHEFAIKLSTHPPAEAGLRDAARALEEPLYVMCAPEYYAASGIFGPIIVRNADKFPRLEGTQDVMLEWILRNQQNFGWYGMADYGDILLDFYWFGLRHWGKNRERWLCRGYAGWLQNDGQLDYIFYLHALRRGDRRLLKFAQRMTQHVADVDTAHLEIPGTDGKQWGKEFNDNHGRFRVGGVNRHNQHHWGDTITSRGTITQGGPILYGITGDSRIKDVLAEVALLLDRSANYEPTDGAGLARLYHIFGDEKMLQRSKELAPTYFGLGNLSFTMFNNVVWGLLFHEQATGDKALRDNMVAVADHLMKPTTNLVDFNSGFAEIMAWHYMQDDKYLAALPRYIKHLDYGGSFAMCDLRGDLKNGAQSLGWSELWKRVQKFQPIMPERPYHLLGKVLNKWPYVLAGLKDESCLDEPKQAAPAQK